jgi:MFS family permease
MGTLEFPSSDAGKRLPVRPVSVARSMIDSIDSILISKPDGDDAKSDRPFKHVELQPSCTTTTNTFCDPESPTQRHMPVPTLLAFMALSVSIFLVALDTVLIPTALPTISRSFDIADSLYAWIGSSYLLANGASVPFWGKISDVFGRKSVLQTANLVFLAGSIVCAVSINAKMLVAGRAVQGLGGGGIVVLVHICVSDLFSIRDRSLYLGILGGVWAVASALGPVLGGIFAQKLGWRWCFYINLPIISISIVVIFLTLRLHDPRTPLVTGLRSMDWGGTITILAATILLLVGLQLGGGTSYHTPVNIAMLVLGSVAYIAFPITQWWAGRQGRSPIMPIHIFRDISNISALAVCGSDALVFNSVAYFLPLYFQIVLGKSPLVAGLYMLAIAIPLAAISFASGHIIERSGRFVEVLQGGLLLMTIGVGLLISLNLSPGLGRILGFLIVIGIGFGPNFGAPLIALQTRIDENDIATGTAAFGFVRMVAGAIGVVVGQVVFQLMLKPHYQRFLDIGLAPAFAKTLVSGEALPQAEAVRQLQDSQQHIVRGSFVTALRGTWIFYTVISALGLAVSFGIKRTRLHRERQRTTSQSTLKDEETAGNHIQNPS